MKKSHSNKVVFTVTQTGVRLVQAVQNQLGSAHSLRSIKRTIDAKGCFVNGKLETFASHKLLYGDQVAFYVPEQKEKEIKLDILYEDEFIRCVNKPSGYVCEDPMLVHRLDKETTGVVCFAKTKEALDAMYDLFKNRKISKEYMAIVCGVLPKKQDTLTAPLKMSFKQKGQKRWQASERGIPATTSYRHIRSKGKLHLLQVIPQTGRMHQIRVHLSSIGVPILGDYVYGNTKSFPFHRPRHLLHAHTLSFEHPILKKTIFVKAPIPKDFSEVMDCTS